MLEVASDVPQQVRTTCTDVAERATSVRIDDEAIASYADALGSGASEPCTVSACDRIADVIRQSDAGFIARDLDYMLWNRGRLPAYKRLPRHRCKTRYY